MYSNLPGQVKYNKSYGGEQYEDNYFQINSLRTGFVGGNNNLNFYLATNENVITVDENGTVETYIDVMIKNKHDFNLYEPSDFIEDIYNQIMSKLKDELITRRTNINLFNVDNIINPILTEQKKRDIVTRILLLLRPNRELIINNILDDILFLFE